MHVHDRDPGSRGDRVDQAGIAEDRVVVDHHGHLVATIEYRQHRATGAGRGRLDRVGRLRRQSRRRRSNSRPRAKGPRERPPVDPAGRWRRSLPQLDDDPGRCSTRPCSKAEIDRKRDRDDGHHEAIVAPTNASGASMSMRVATRSIATTDAIASTPPRQRAGGHGGPCPTTAPRGRARGPITRHRPASALRAGRTSR